MALHRTLWTRLKDADRQARSSARKLLRQGITSEKIALSVAIGVVAGIFPIIGVTTLLSFGFGLALRLNLVVVQFFNGICYPLQLLMILPLVRLGRRLFADDALPVPLGRIVEVLESNPSAAFGELWALTWQAIAAWSLLAPLLTAGLYLLLVPLIRRWRPEASPAAELIPEPPA